jgi:hypothetical protein
MNAMLEARVVAASTQGPEDLGQGAVAGREPIMLASQGSWRTGNIFQSVRLIREQLLNEQSRKVRTRLLKLRSRQAAKIL